MVYHWEGSNKVAQRTSQNCWSHNRWYHGPRWYSIQARLNGIHLCKVKGKMHWTCRSALFCYLKIANTWGITEKDGWNWRRWKSVELWLFFPIWHSYLLCLLDSQHLVPSNTFLSMCEMSSYVPVSQIGGKCKQRFSSRRENGSEACPKVRTHWALET